MELHKVLSQIADIRRWMARGEVDRDLRSVTVTASGVLGLLAAAVRPFWVASPERELDRHLSYRGGVAAASLAAVGIEVFARCRAASLGLSRQMSLAAVEPFLPSVVVGALMAACVARAAPDAAWMLPGLRALVYGPGVFAAYRLLPRQSVCVGAYYVLCGCGCLLCGRGGNAFHPWLMGVTFGGGQLLGAAVLYGTLERADAAEG